MIPPELFSRTEALGRYRHYTRINLGIAFGTTVGGIVNCRLSIAAEHIGQMGAWTPSS
jgi:hypothetical protein